MNVCDRPDCENDGELVVRSAAWTLRVCFIHADEFGGPMFPEWTHEFRGRFEDASEA